MMRSSAHRHLLPFIPNQSQVMNGGSVPERKMTIKAPEIREANFKWKLYLQRAACVEIMMAEIYNYQMTYRLLKVQ